MEKSLEVPVPLEAEAFQVVVEAVEVTRMGRFLLGPFEHEPCCLRGKIALRQQEIE